MKRFLKVAGILFLIMVAGYVTIHFYAKQKISAIIRQDFMDGSLSYQSLDINILLGSAELHKVVIPQSETSPLTGKVDNINVQGLELWKLLTDRIIDVELIEVSGYDLRFRESKIENSESTTNYQLKVDRISIGSGTLSRSTGERNIAYVSINGADMNDVSLQSNDPIGSFGAYIDNFEVDSTFIKLSKRENLYIAGLTIYNDSIIGRSLKLVTNDSVQALAHQNKINYDVLNLDIPNIKLSGYKLNHTTEHDFYAGQIILDEPVFEVRANSNSTSRGSSPTYHQMLRNIKSVFQIDGIKINDATITYNEPNPKSSKRGILKFDNINGEIKNFTNLHNNHPIQAALSSRVMGSSNVDVDWSMDISSDQDDFQVKASMLNFDVASLNSFVNPVLNMSLKGNVSEYYITLNGQKDFGMLSTRLAYSDIKIDLQKSNGHSKWLKSAFANLLINNNQTDPITVRTKLTRDQTKSMINFIWKIQKKAIKDVLK